MQPDESEALLRGFVGVVRALAEDRVDLTIPGLGGAGALGALAEALEALRRNAEKHQQAEALLKGRTPTSCGKGSRRAGLLQRRI